MSTVEHDLAVYEREVDEGAMEAEAHLDSGEDLCDVCDEWMDAEDLISLGDRLLCSDCHAILTEEDGDESD